jgi:hypothetical protein
MSKAFTREDDTSQQGDLLPERSIPPHPNLVTAEGLAQINDAVTRLTEQHNAARTAGDAGATANTARDLRYWSARRATAQLTEPKTGLEEVQFGSRVTSRGLMDRPGPTASSGRMRATRRKRPCRTPHPWRRR